MYFYKNANGSFTLGNMILPAGICEAKISTTTINIFSGGIEIVPKTEATLFKTQAGVAYTNMTSLLAAIGDLFTSVDSLTFTAGSPVNNPYGNASVDTLLRGILQNVIKPNYIDTASDPIFYEGYFLSGTSYLVSKVDTTTAVITRTYATGAWADRATLTYA